MSEPKLSEKKVLTEFLQLFRELPCLWDNNHSLYSNKEARTRAYQLLLEKYRLINPEANLETVKKRIENMRTCYRRERKKVISELLKHGEDRKPSLWYYDHLKFLDVMESYEILEEDNLESNDVKQEMEAHISSVFLTENNEDLEEETRSYIINDQSSVRAENMTEGEAFGRLIGLQLNELQPVQRYIAEKLISDVIYYARFQKLDISTRLSNV